MGAGTLHPFIAPIQQCAEWYWKDKLWTLSVGTADGPVVVTDLQFFASDDVGYATSQLDLICRGAHYIIQGSSSGLLYEISFLALAGEPSGALSPAGTPGVSFTTDGIRKSGSDYYPQLLFRLFYPNPASSDLSTYNDGGGTGATVALDFDGYSVPLYTVEQGGFTDASFTPQTQWP